MVEERTALTGFVIILSLFVISVIVQAVNYEPRARQMPLLIAVPTAVLLFWRLYTIKTERYFDEDSSNTDVDVTEDEIVSDSTEVVSQEPEAMDYPEVIRMVLWAAGLVALIYLFGYIMAIPIFTFLFLFVYGDIDPMRAGSVAAALTLTIYILFVVVLDLDLWQGVFGFL